MAKKTNQSREITILQIVQALLDLSRPVPPRYLYKLSDINPRDLQVLKDAWPKISTERKRNIMEDLNDFGESDETLEFYDVGLLGLADPDAQVRLSAVRILDDYQDDELVPEFLRLLANDPSVEVRAAAVTALGAFVYLGEVEEIDPEDYKKVEETLLATYKGTDEILVRRRALEALGFSSLPEVSGLIQAAFDSGDSSWQVSALFAMGRSYDQEWAPVVLSMLADDRAAVRAEAAEAAGELELSDARQPLLEMLEDPDENVRAAAIWSLSQIGGDEVGERLESLLEETEDEDEADLIEQALENLEFNEDFNFDFLDIQGSEGLDDFNEDDLLPGISDNSRRN